MSYIYIYQNVYCIEINDCSISVTQYISSFLKVSLDCIYFIINFIIINK